MRYDLYNPAVQEGQPIGYYELGPMQGCPRVGISYGLHILPEFRKKGFAYRAMEDRMAQAKADGYEILLATVVEGNKPEEKTLEKYKWRRLTILNNLKTGHTVNLWMKHLNDPYEDWIGGCR